MQRRLSDQREDLLASIIKRVPRTAQTAIFSKTDLIERYFADVPEEDLQDHRPEDLAALAIAHLTFATQRAKCKPLVRVFNPTKKDHGWTSTHTAIQIVNDDMPFLVDSVGMALARSAVGPLLTFHPVIRVVRTPRGRLKQLARPEGNGADTAESYIYVEIPREPDKQRREMIEEEIRATLARRA